MKRGALISPMLKWEMNEFGKEYLNFRDIIFCIHQVSDRAYGVEVLLPHIRNDYVDNTGWLAYDRDFEEGYESIESAKYAAECWLSNVLHFDFTDDEKDNKRCSK